MCPAGNWQAAPVRCFRPVQSGANRRSGDGRRGTESAHPTGAPLSGGPQMVEISRDGRRGLPDKFVVFHWDDQFYPDGLNGWLSLIDVNPEGGIAVNRELLYRLWQVTGAPGEVAGRRRFFGYLLLPVGVLFALTSPPRVAWAGRLMRDAFGSPRFGMQVVWLHV